jgi:hypothetical protein
MRTSSTARLNLPPSLGPATIKFKAAEAHGRRQRKASSAKDEFSVRVQRFVDTTVVPQLHEAALKDALKAPTEFETILHALERPEVSAAVRDQDPLAMARLRGISGKRRILTENGGLLSAEKVGEILHNEPTGGGEAAKGRKAH